MDRAQHNETAHVQLHPPPQPSPAATTPIVRQTNDAARARQLQLKKNAQHAEEIEDLDEQGVDTIRDEHQGTGDNPEPEHHKPKSDQVEIASLSEMPLPPTSLGAPPHLDISA